MKKGFEKDTTRRKSSISLSYERNRKLSAVSGRSLAHAHRMLKDIDDSKVEAIDEISFKLKCIYTSVMFLQHLNFGISMSGFAPSFVDFKSLMDVSMQYIGMIPSVIGLGCVCGSCCGFIYKYFNRQFIIAMLIAGMGASTIMMPYSSEIWHMYICMFVYGFGIGAWNSSNNIWLMEMWQSNSPSMLMLSQSIYGVGTIIGPWIVRPFLSGEFEEEDEFENFHNGTNSSITTRQFHNDNSLEIHGKLKLPYLINGCLQMIGPIFMFTLFWIKKYHYTSVPKVVKDEKVEETSEIESLISKNALIILTAFFFATFIMTENMYMDFSPTFFHFITLKVPVKKAAEIASTMAIALTSGRAICIFIAMKVRPQFMIAGCATIVWIGYVIQYFGQNVLWILWGTALIISAGYSCIYVALYAFVNQYFEVTDAIGTIFLISYNSIYLVLPFFLGGLIEEFPNFLILIVFTAASIAYIDFAIILFIVRKVPASMLRV